MIYEIRKYNSKADYSEEVYSGSIVWETKEQSISPIGKLIYYYGNMNKVVIPEGIESIGKGIFEGIDEYSILGNKIGELILPESLKEIEMGAFTSQDDIFKITCKSKNFIVKKGALYSLDGKIMYYDFQPTFKEEEVFKVPEGVEIISGGNDYFGLIIPASVKKICGNFYNVEIYAPKGSYAIKYAKENDLNYYEVDYNKAEKLMKEEFNK